MNNYSRPPPLNPIQELDQRPTPLQAPDQRHQQPPQQPSSIPLSQSTVHHQSHRHVQDSDPFQRRVSTPEQITTKPSVAEHRRDFRMAMHEAEPTSVVTIAGGIGQHVDTEMTNPTLASLKKKHRPRTSCDQCRHRKVKCDRVQPCLACCQAGRPRECHFPGQAGDNAVPQSQEIKTLRRSNADLRRRVAELEDQARNGTGPPKPTIGTRGLDRGFGGDDLPWDQDLGAQMNGGRRSSPPLGASASKPTSKIGVNGKVEKHCDSLFFGTPPVSEVMNELGAMSTKERQHSPSSSSLAYLHPRGFDIEAYEGLPPYPFPSLWLQQHRMTPLLQILPPEAEIMALLKTFEAKRTCCLYPHQPKETTREQAKVFLADLHGNSERDPQLLALLFSTLALGALLERFNESRKGFSPLHMERERRKADVFVAASMHALRLSSFMNRPSLTAIQALLMVGAYLNSAANFTNAFSLFGVTIRLAQCIGMHRNPTILKPIPSEETCRLRRILWWYMLYMDVKYSITLGRPLGISGIGDCQPALPVLADHTVTRFLLFANQFTILGRQILASENTSNEKIDKFSDDLLKLFDTLPAVIRFETSWLQEVNASGWPLGPHALTLFTEIHNHLVLLNRQRRPDNGEHGKRGSGLAGVQGGPGQPSSASALREAPTLRGYPRVIASSRAILEAFIFCRRHVPTVLSAWTFCQKAFNAAMILALHMRDTFDASDLDIVITVQEMFVEMRRNNSHHLAGLASERLHMLTDPAWNHALRQQAQQQQQHQQQHQQQQHQHNMSQEADPSIMSQPSPPAWLEQESVMGGTGMMLLDDHGLHEHVASRY